MSDLEKIKNDVEDKKVEKQKISTEHLKKNPRIGKIELAEERFFAYEKQKSHN